MIYENQKPESHNNVLSVLVSLVIGGLAGAIGGIFIALIVGEILQKTGSYVPIFIIAGSAYLVALLIIHVLAPRLEPAKL